MLFRSRRTYEDKHAEEKVIQDRKKQIQNGQLEPEKKLFQEWNDKIIKELNEAVEKENNLRKKLLDDDPYEFAENYFDYTHGSGDVVASRDEDWAEYKEADDTKKQLQEIAGNADAVQAWIENQVTKGNSPTMDDIDDYAEERTNAKSKFKEIAVPVIYAAIGYAQVRGNQNKKDQQSKSKSDQVSEVNKNGVAKNPKQKNYFKPDPKASGDHSVFRRNETGQISKYETYKSNPRNPTGFDSMKRVDTQYSSPHTHVNKITGNSIPVPHVHGKKIPGGVRSPFPGELPN